MASFVDDEAEVGTTSEDEPMDAEESSAKKKKKKKITLNGLKAEIKELKRGNDYHEFSYEF